MRRLIHLMLSPSCRLARLMVAEKRVACDPVLSDDPKASMPVLVDLDGTIAHNDGHRGFFDWAKVGDDKPHEDVIRLVQTLW